jgi:hypothetical protein
VYARPRTRLRPVPFEPAPADGAYLEKRTANRYPLVVITLRYAFSLGVLCAVWLLPAVGDCQLVGDANCEGRVDAVIIAALFAVHPCSQADVNADGVVSAADLPAGIAAVVASPTPTLTPEPSITPTGAGITPTAAATMTATTTVTMTATTTATPASTATATPSPSSTRTVTPTPTMVLCPTQGAAVEVSIDNRTSMPQLSVTLTGRRVIETCRNTSGLDETYSMPAAQSPQSIENLAPGVWVHTLFVDVPASGQQQHQPSLLLAGTGTNEVRFTAFESVMTVRTAVDATGNGSLRDALLAVDGAPKPALIQFDDQAFPPGLPTVIELSDALPRLATTDVTLDALDATGTAGNRIIDASGLPVAALSISGSANTVVGLALRNSGANNRDVLSLGPNASGNLVDRCIIAQAATGDGIGIDGNSGSDFKLTANVISNSEVSAASDKGIKVTTNSYALLEDNWVHDNANGGIQATLSGHILARDNLVERSGGASAENGFSANSSGPDTPAIPSELQTDGNVSRFNAANGVSVRGLSVASLKNDYYSANGSSGLRVFDQGLPPALASVEGSTAACNGVDGAAVADNSRADFGGGMLDSPGDNAFTQNNLQAGGANLRNSTGTTVSAVNNQWEHCGPETTCKAAAISAYDLSDHGVYTAFVPAQAQRSQRAPALVSVRPTKGIAGELLRIFGSGFNVIDGHANGTTCADVTSYNHCTPMRGNCVRIGGVSAPIEAVTPTMLVVRFPVSCVSPQPLTVQTQGGGMSAPLTVCTNP